MHVFSAMLARRKHPLIFEALTTIIWNEISFSRSFNHRPRVRSDVEKLSTLIFSFKINQLKHHQIISTAVEKYIDRNVFAKCLKWNFHYIPVFSAGNCALRFFFFFFVILLWIKFWQTKRSISKLYSWKFVIFVFWCKRV